MRVRSLALFLLVTYIVAMSDAFAADTPQQPRNEREERLAPWANKV